MTFQLLRVCLWIKWHEYWFRVTDITQQANLQTGTPWLMRVKCICMWVYIYTYAHEYVYNLVVNLTVMLKSREFPHPLPLLGSQNSACHTLILKAEWKIPWEHNHSKQKEIKILTLGRFPKSSPRLPYNKSSKSSDATHPFRVSSVFFLRS